MGLTADLNGYVQSETCLLRKMNVDVNAKLLETNSAECRVIFR